MKKLGRVTVSQLITPNEEDIVPIVKKTLPTISTNPVVETSARSIPTTLNVDDNPTRSIETDIKPISDPDISVKDFTPEIIENRVITSPSLVTDIERTASAEEVQPQPSIDELYTQDQQEALAEAWAGKLTEAADEGFFDNKFANLEVIEQPQESRDVPTEFPEYETPGFTVKDAAPEDIIDVPITTPDLTTPDLRQPEADPFIQTDNEVYQTPEPTVEDQSSSTDEPLIDLDPLPTIPAKNVDPGISIPANYAPNPQNGSYIISDPSQDEGGMYYDSAGNLVESSPAEAGILGNKLGTVVAIGAAVALATVLFSKEGPGDLWMKAKKEIKKKTPLKGVKTMIMG